ncbi:MAG: elongation factor G [Caldiserica bacterium]|nr:MAG: elongation factor G [Caldisericota bacterium]
MKLTPDKIRNICFTGARGSGKTQLAEAILFACGITSRLNLVDKGNSIFDSTQEEIDKKMTLTLSCGHIIWKDTKINIIDTPGEVDFLGDIISGIYFSDAVCIIISNDEGISVGTYKAWEYAQKFNKPVFIFINKIDKKKEIDELVSKIKEEISINVAPCFIPSDGGVKDILKEDDPQKESLIEVIASSDDELTEKYLESGTLSEDEIQTGFKKGIISGKIIPILCGSAIDGKGVKEFLDFVVEKIPSPKDINSEVDENGSFLAQSFKIMFEPHMGEILYFKVLRGKLNHGEDVYNVTSGVSERMGQIYFPVGKKQRVEAKEVIAGDIACALKLKGSSSFDTFSKNKEEKPLPKPEFPAPTAWMAVYAKEKGEEEKVANSISTLLREDPTLRFGYNPEIKEMILEGLGNTQLEIMVRRAKERFQARLELRKPRIPYKETIRSTVEKVEGKYKRQTGGRGQYGHVWIKLEPLPRGQGFEFVNKIVGGRIPSNYIPAVEKGLRSAMDEGVIAGYPVVDLRITLFDGSYHEVDSSNIAFEIAARMALKKGVEMGSPWVLEPIMEVEVIVPEEFTGSIVGDLNGRRGRVLGMERVGKKQIIKAHVPQKELFTYSQDLRSMTRGLGEFKMKFSHYEEAPGNITQELIDEFKRKKEENK